MSLTENHTSGGIPAAKTQAPLPVKMAVMGAVVAMLSGAVYLIAVRGEALLLDLSTFAGRILCF
jgi:hypothetical protein